MTKIEWTDRTHNITVGCSRQSTGCEGCYAEAMAVRLMHHPAYKGVLRKSRGLGSRWRWSGRVNLVPERLPEILRWRKPHRCFIGSMSDLWHPRVPKTYIAASYATFAAAPHVTFQLLTKQHMRLEEYYDWLMGQRDPVATMVDSAYKHWPGSGRGHRRRLPKAVRELEVDPILPNVWLGVSAEDNTYLKLRGSVLMRMPAAVRFLSLEPLLNPLPDFGARLLVGADGRTLDWGIIGGETGRAPRFFEVDEAIRVANVARELGIALFVKQLGAAPRLRGNLVQLRNRKGSDLADFPKALRYRQFPKTRRKAVA